MEYCKPECNVQLTSKSEPKVKKKKILELLSNVTAKSLGQHELKIDPIYFHNASFSFVCIIPKTTHCRHFSKMILRLHVL